MASSEARGIDSRRILRASPPSELVAIARTLPPGTHGPRDETTDPVLRSGWRRRVAQTQILSTH